MSLLVQPAATAASLGAVNYKGAWNANTNNPSLSSGVGTQGDYYVVSTNGATNLDGITDWKAGDWAIFNGSVWQKIDNTDLVTSVNGATGAVSLTTSDISDSTDKRYVTDAGLINLGNTSGINTGDQTLPVKATGAEINTGTDDEKFATAKAIADSNIAFLSDIPAGFSWGASISGTTSPGLNLTLDNNSVSGAIAESIVFGNTQSNSLVGLQIDTGTAVVNHSALILKVLNTGTSGTSGGVVLNTYGSATQALGTGFGFNSGGNFNTNSSNDWYHFYLTNEQNAGSGRNVMLFINNNATDFQTSSGLGAAIAINQQGVNGTAMCIIGNANINSGTNGLMYMTLSDTQSGATIMQKVNMGTSVQSNIGYNVVIPANSTATAFQVDHTGSNNNVSKTLVATTTSSGFSTATFSIFEAIGRNSQIKALEALSVFSGTTGERTTNYVNLKIDRTNTAAFTRTDNFAAFSMIRSDNVNNAGATLNAQGSVGFFQHTATNSAGTMNDTVDILRLYQDSDSTGNLITGSGDGGSTTTFAVDKRGTVTATMGTGTGTHKLSGFANINTTAVGNVGTGEDDLITYPLAANSMSSAGKGIRIIAWGSAANNANTKTLKLYFGSQIILTNSITAAQAGVWRVEAIVLSTGTDTQDWMSHFSNTGTVSTSDNEIGTATEDDGSIITIKCTGDATDNNDIIQEGLTVEFIN